jgi:hypothetical protein
MNLLEEENILTKKCKSSLILLLFHLNYTVFFFLVDDSKDEISRVCLNLNMSSNEIKNFEINECEDALESTIIAK